MAVLHFLGRYDLRDLRTSLIWGYGHHLVFASIAAVGASLAALFDEVSLRHGHLPAWGQALTLAVPVAVFLCAIAGFAWVCNGHRRTRWFVAAAVIVVVRTLVGAPGPTQAVAAVAATTAVFLAVEVLSRGKAAVVDY